MKKILLILPFLIFPIVYFLFFSDSNKLQIKNPVRRGTITIKTKKNDKKYLSGQRKQIGNAARKYETSKYSVFKITPISKSCKLALQKDITEKKCLTELKSKYELSDDSVNSLLQSCELSKNLNKSQSFLNSFGLDITKDIDQHYLNSKYCKQVFNKNLESIFTYYSLHQEEFLYYRNKLAFVLYHLAKQKIKPTDNSYTNKLKYEVLMNLLNNSQNLILNLSDAVIANLLIFSYGERKIEVSKNFIYTLKKYREFGLIEKEYQRLRLSNKN